MAEVMRDFQVFAKPVGPLCNLACKYCYYLDKKGLHNEALRFLMPEDILEKYIFQHINAVSSSIVQFSWHGGEPTIAGIDYFRKIVMIQQRYKKPHQQIINGIQTNGTLLNDDWCKFLSKEGFIVGISLDGPKDFHNLYRLMKNNNPTFELTLRGYNLLREYGIPCNILCVVHRQNVEYPLKIYRFFKELGARYIEFLPLVEQDFGGNNIVTARTVPSKAFGEFLCSIFDEWLSEDIERINIQIFEEIARTALTQDHALCIFRKTCGNVPVIEHNGDFFSCDHFVKPEYWQGNINHVSLIEFLESPRQKRFGENKWLKLPKFCLSCEVLDFCYGGCPKDRFLKTPDGEPGLNYLCKGYKLFFNHCKSFVKELSSLSQKQFFDKSDFTEKTQKVVQGAKIGRNDPCPCGSGKKYKKCCLNKNLFS